MTTIYRGDTMPLVVSWFLPDPDQPFIENDAAINEATVRVVRLRDAKTVLDNEPATISGNETTFVIPADVIRIDSEYAAFVTARFNDDSIVTRRVDFAVRPRR